MRALMGAHGREGRRAKTTKLMLTKYNQREIGAEDRVAGWRAAFLPGVGVVL